MGLGFLALPVGISLADDLGKVAFVWLFVSYVLQSVGELLISPIGYAMIGKLAPRQYQGIMMGSWMLVTGVPRCSPETFPNDSGARRQHRIDHNPGLFQPLRAIGWAAPRWASCWSC